MGTHTHETSNMESAYYMGIPNLSHFVMPAYVMQDNTMYRMCVYYRLACKYLPTIVTQSTVHCGGVLLRWHNYLCNGACDIIVALKIELTLASFAI